jgi:tetratricopeptide (TPR) repeat protein
MRKASLLVFLCLLTTLSLHAATPAENAAEGQSLMERQEFEKASHLLEKAVAGEPNNAQYHYLLGGAYGEMAMRAGMMGKVSLAKKTRAEIERAVELNPRHTEARLSLISYYLMAPGFLGGGEDKAIAQANAIRAYDGIDGHRAWARLYTTQKKPDLALKELVAAVRENPKSAKAHTSLGSFYMNEKKWAESLHEYDMALQLDPGYMPVYLRIGQLAARSGSNYARGEESLRKYLSYKPALTEPGHGSTWYVIGLIQEKQGRKAEAKQSFTTANKLMPGDKNITEALKRLK